jgi:hypothetical protein
MKKDSDSPKNCFSWYGKTEEKGGCDGELVFGKKSSKNWTTYTLLHNFVCNWDITA